MSRWLRHVGYGAWAPDHRFLSISFSPSFPFRPICAREQRFALFQRAYLVAVLPPQSFRPCCLLSWLTGSRVPAASLFPLHRYSQTHLLIARLWLLGAALSFCKDAGAVIGG